jgi:hypothetical protein
VRARYPMRGVNPRFRGEGEGDGSGRGTGVVGWSCKLQRREARGEQRWGRVGVGDGKNRGCYRGDRARGDAAALRARDGERLRCSVVSDLDGG